MRRLVALLIVLSIASLAYAGSGTLRVGSQVLAVGDSATRVIELLGKPSYRTHAASNPGRHGSGRRSHRGNSSSFAGEQWQYRQGSRVVIIVLVDGKVAAIRDDGR